MARARKTTRTCCTPQLNNSSSFFLSEAETAKTPAIRGILDHTPSSAGMEALLQTDLCGQRTRSLAEASRVLKPGGEFLMMVVTKDLWLTATFGPLLLHSGFRSPESWTGLLQDAGFQMVEQGTRPGTLYFLAQKP
jgi:hypothetical protein